MKTTKAGETYQIERHPEKTLENYKYETHNDRLLNEVFSTPEKLVKRAVLLGKVAKEIEHDLVEYIDQVMDGNNFYHMTDYRVDENGTVSIPLTLKSLDGFLNQWEHERQGLVEPSAPSAPDQLPEELDTPEAREIFDKAIGAGFMNNDYTFNGNKYQMAYFAEKASEHLGLKYKWKPFIELWNYKHFSQTRYETKERYGHVDKQDEIDKIFL